MHWIMSDFSRLGLKKDILNLVRTMYKEPSPVQEKVVPLAVQGKNVVFTSMTGSGKTLAYLLGFIGKIDRKKGLQMVVVVPARELCIQVGKEIQEFVEKLDLSVGTLYGGRDLAGDKRTTGRKNQIMVGTPGRLTQHINEKHIKIGEIGYLVFDESDQMFDFGFYDSCAYLRKRASSNVQIILSSATITTKVEQFIKTEIIDYELLKIGVQIPEIIIQEKVSVRIDDKNQFLAVFFKRRFRKALVFCNTKKRTVEIPEFLKKFGLNAGSLNGDLEQKERVNILNRFKDGNLPILVTTDVAARGIHIEDVDIVINYDAPKRSEFYVHRIGRTGRGGKKGYALSLVCPQDVDRFALIEREFGLKLKDYTES